jgi:hypothetical protein
LALARGLYRRREKGCELNDKEQDRLERRFSRIESALPGPFDRMLAWLRRPGATLVRVPLGILLVLGGIFSILPVLGIWMLPLGLLLLSVDLPLLAGPVARFLVRFDRWWETRRRRKRDS